MSEILLRKIEEVGEELARRGYEYDAGVEGFAVLAKHSWVLAYVARPKGKSGHIRIVSSVSQKMMTPLRELNEYALAQAAQLLPELCRAVAAAHAIATHPDFMVASACSDAWDVINTLPDHSKNPQ